MVDSTLSPGANFTPKSNQDPSVVEVERVEPPGDSTVSVENLVSKNLKRKWVSYLWDSLDKSPEERRLLFKLDCVLLTLSCLGKRSNAACYANDRSLSF